MPVPFKVRVYERLVALFHKTFTYTPTHQIVRDMRQSYFRTYRALRALEASGLIIRQTKNRHACWRPAQFPAGVYAQLRDMYRRIHQPVTSHAISLPFDYTTRHITTQLGKLENAGIIERQTERTGWQPIRTTPPPASQKILETLTQLYKAHQHPIPTSFIAAQLNISSRHVTRTLSQYEQLNLTRRNGQRSGWLPLTA